MSLAALALGQSARVTSVSVEGQVGPWLAAVGINEGEQVVVLRRAPFGGPLHIRTGAGGEFALCRSLAKAVAVESCVPVVPVEPLGNAGEEAAE